MRGPSPRNDVVIFVGPTLATNPRARALARPYHLRPAVKRFDVAKLVDRRTKPGVLVLVDGVFHDTLAVGHAEIREALRRGWQVWGLSSMGAIRAREMSSLGMRGFGRVFQRFQAEEDFQDDEVALLHEPTAPYRPVTEPLFHLREAIDYLVVRGHVRVDHAKEVILDLKSRWYGERTVRGTLHALARSSPEASRRIAAELHDFERFRIKTADLVQFLEERPWHRTS